VRKGLCPVTKERQQNEVVESHSLYYEVHGSGPEKLVFVMGLNSSSFSWRDQVVHFSRAQAGKFSVLVFDNRGVGNSASPRGPYSTRGMAEDILVLLDLVGWTEMRQLHIVGISLGGMIALELVDQIAPRVASLTLAVTTAGGRAWNNFPPWKGLVTLTKLMGVSDPNVKVPMVLDMSFPKEWLDSKAESDPAGRTNLEVQTELFLQRIEVTRPQSLTGALSQMASGLTHSVNSERLRKISSSVPKVLILTGDQDNLVSPANSRHLKANMPEAELVEWNGTGHPIHLQWPERFNELLERVFAEGRARAV